MLNYPCLLVLLGGLVSAWPGSRLISRQLECSSHPYRLETAAQVLTRSEPLCRAVMGADDCSYITADKETVWLGGQAAVALWRVDCYSDTGTTSATFLWSAGTGELRSIRYGEPFCREGAPLTRSQAVALAWECLQGLSSPDRRPRWQQVGPPEHALQHWLLHYRCQDRDAEIEIMDYTGDLILFNQHSVTSMGMV